MKAGRTGSVAALMLWVLPGLTGTALAAGKAELQRFIRERADHLREQGVTIDLWK